MIIEKEGEEDCFQNGYTVVNLQNSGIQNFGIDAVKATFKGWQTLGSSKVWSLGL